MADMDATHLPREMHDLQRDQKLDRLLLLQDNEILLYDVQIGGWF